MYGTNNKVKKRKFGMKLRGLRDVMLRNYDLPKDKSTLDQILNFFS